MILRGDDLHISMSSVLLLRVVDRQRTRSIRLALFQRSVEYLEEVWIIEIHVRNEILLENFIKILLFQHLCEIHLNRLRCALHLLSEHNLREGGREGRGERTFSLLSKVYFHLLNLRDSSVREMVL